MQEAPYFYVGLILAEFALVDRYEYAYRLGLDVLRQNSSLVYLAAGRRTSRAAEAGEARIASFVRS